MANVFNRLTEKHKKIVSWIGLAALVGISFMLFQPQYSPQTFPEDFYTSKESAGDVLDLQLYAERLERRLKSIVSAAVGGMNVEVFLTLERGPRLLIAESKTEDHRITSDGTEETRWTSTPTVLRMDGERKEIPLVLEEEEPMVRGVVVVIPGVYDADARLRIARAVQTVLQIPMYRIEVLFRK